MTYRLRVSLPGIKGFARVYEIGARHTLHHLHKQMNADMDFPPDQIVLFKAINSKGELVGRYATFDMGNGSIDKINIAMLVEKDVKQMFYFYDTINKKSVTLSFEGEGSLGFENPTLIESKGPNPDAFENGYISFEDKEEDELVYDGGEQAEED